MTSEIPSHHLKQTVCATRPPYREGRRAKAVKVYTVNNESCYVLIQGVPSVGATQELLKLCSSFGVVEQYNALDDYPNEDKYSEVYLVKYKKIQSARFAKRKLDDYSFFGGLLHVCYAPEYESVAETREKLQDRRRVVAAKIRLHAQNLGRQQLLSIESSQNSAQLLDKSAESNLNEQFLQNNLKIHFENQHSCLENSSVPIPQKSDSTAGQTLPAVSSLSTTQTFPAASAVSTNNLQNIDNEVNNMWPTFELPLPPKSNPLTNFHAKGRKNVYEFSRVPSAHAALPAGYDGRLVPDSLKSSSQTEITPDITQQSSFDNASQDERTKEGIPGASLRPPTTSSSIIIRDYTPKQSTPRFVPRQAVKSKAEKLETGSVASWPASADHVDAEIRRNAFRLGETQGPAAVPHRKRELSTAAHRSVNETICEIRNKISKVITENIKSRNT